MNDSAFRRRILAWYAKHARSLPWRGTADPYHVWVSEIMLQQTTTKTVEGYFDRFISAFPTIRHLAAAELDAVKRLWEGLGYYRRCVQLHRAAQEIVAKFDGVFPKDNHTVLQLPGIGRYTAGAILSIAFDQRLPILEANTLRLHARLTALRADPAQRAANEQLWKFAEDILPKKGSGRFNQALMDIGSLVCTPKEPFCNECPVRNDCESAKHGLQSVIPYQKAKEQKTYRTEVALVVRKRAKFLLIRYPEGMRWAGLWDFPRTESNAEIPLEIATDAELCRRLAEMTGRNLKPGRVIETVKHSVTRYRITLFFCEGTDAGIADISTCYETCWATFAELQTLPMNSTARKFIEASLKNSSISR